MDDQVKNELCYDDLWSMCLKGHFGIRTWRTPPNLLDIPTWPSQNKKKSVHSPSKTLNLGHFHVLLGGLHHWHMHLLRHWHVNNLILKLHLQQPQKGGSWNDLRNRIDFPDIPVKEYEIYLDLQGVSCLEVPVRSVGPSSQVTPY